MSAPATPFPAPLIILGSPRSFTSLICGMLGQHPEAYGMPELNLFMSDSLKTLVEELTGYRQIQIHGLLRAVAQLYVGEQTLLGVDMARRWLLIRFGASTADVYRELCRKVAPLRIIDKSPVYSLKPENLRRVHAAFPDARYLHLLRHPRAQGESIMKVAKGLMATLANSIDYSTDPPTIDPQIVWYDMQRHIMEFLGELPAENHLRLRGEDVLSAPQEQLGHVCRWLGISADPGAIEAMLHPEDSPYAHLGPVGAHLGNDINYLRDPAFKAGAVSASTLAGALPWRADGKGFEARVVELAQQFGYE
jgi:Sulfotransferase family